MKYLLIIIIFLFGTLIFANPIFASEKRIEIDLTTQHLYAYENSKLVYNFLISSGKWYPTPIGTFKPWAKIKSQSMVGGSKSLGTYYNLPNVPDIIYFYKGYAIHGTYWHNNFGYPMSHGCINASLADAKLLYDFIEMDTPIIIYGRAPF